MKAKHQPGRTFLIEVRVTYQGDGCYQVRTEADRCITYLDVRCQDPELIGGAVQDAVRRHWQDIFYPPESNI